MPQQEETSIRDKLKGESCIDLVKNLEICRQLKDVEESIDDTYSMDDYLASLRIKLPCSSFTGYMEALKLLEEEGRIDESIKEKLPPNKGLLEFHKELKESIPHIWFMDEPKAEVGVIRVKKTKENKQVEYETWTIKEKDLVYRAKEISHLANPKSVAIVGTWNNKADSYVYENFVLRMEDTLEELNRKVKMLKAAEIGLRAPTMRWNLDEIDKNKAGIFYITCYKKELFLQGCLADTGALSMCFQLDYVLN